MIAAFCGFIYGALGAFLFRRLTDPGKIRLTVNRILAHIMEFRLFLDEPALVWQAQRAAIRAHLTLLRLIILPCAAMSVLFALMYLPLEKAFGHGPLRIDEPAVITARTDIVPQIEGIVVETPGVRIARTGEVTWRIRPVSGHTGRVPRGVEINYPQNGWWILWFFVFSCAGAAVSALMRLSSVTL